MAIENRNLEPGTRLIASYKKETYHAVVAAAEAGKVTYTLIPPDGKEYKSPSALGTAVTGKACNGWTFWSLATSETDTITTVNLTTTADTVDDAGESADEAEDETEDDGPTFRRVPNQRGLDEGQVRLYCDACHASFIVPDYKHPEACPMGHQPS